MPLPMDQWTDLSDVCGLTPARIRLPRSVVLNLLLARSTGSREKLCHEALYRYRSFQRRTGPSLPV